MDDLHRVLNEAGHRMSHDRIRRTIKAAGFRWRKAKVVLTSKDPDYRAKLDGIKRILSQLKEDEAFLSGICKSFAVTMAGIHFKDATTAIAFLRSRSLPALMKCAKLGSSGECGNSRWSRGRGLSASNT